MYLFISHKCLLLGIRNWHLLARQSWQLLHWALNTSDDLCACICSFARCNPCFVFFQVSELLDLKLSGLFWKPCWKPHKTFRASLPCLAQKGHLWFQEGTWDKEGSLTDLGPVLISLWIALSELWQVFRWFRMWLAEFLVGFSVHACFTWVRFPWDQIQSS